MNFYSHQVYSVLFLFRYILLQAAILTNTIIIFLYKENIIIKENLWIQKRQYILKFTLDVFFCPEFIFFEKHGYILFMQVYFVLFILLLKVRFSLNDTLDFSGQRCDEMKKKATTQWCFFPPRKKIIVLVVRAIFSFFNIFLENIIKLFVLNQIMMTEYKAKLFITCFMTRWGPYIKKNSKVI